MDYSKAFDSISKSFLLNAFKVFGFGTDFRKWVSVLTTGTKSSINHGGWISEAFDTQCGIRQGCPFSPLAFVLAVELIAIKIRNSSITGIKVTTHEDTATIKIKQLADDTTLFLTESEDMQKALDIFTLFQTFSGLRINVHKTKALKLGRQRQVANLPFHVVDKIKILGINFE